MLPEKIKVLIDLGIGDGSITKTSSNNANFTIGHGMKQAEYAAHKASLLRSYGLDARENIYTARSGKNKGQSFYRVYVPVCDECKLAYKWLYNCGRKALDHALFQHLDERSLAYWFMDDGCAKTTNYIKHSDNRYVYDQRKVGSYIFSTDSFSFDECNIMIQWLNVSFNIHAVIGNYSGKPRVMINDIASKDKFRSIVEPFIVDSLRYKISYVHSFTNIPFRIVPTVTSAVEETERKGLE